MIFNIIELTKKIIITFLISFVIFIYYGASESEAMCKPNSDQVAFFQHPNYSGKCSIRGVGDYPTSPATGLKNDTLSSILVGSDAQVVICIDRNYRKNCERHVKSISKLHGRRVGNDKMTSAKVQRLGFRNCKPRANQVSFFEHPDFTGKCVVKNIGNYPTSPATGLKNDTLSSILVGSDAQVVICIDRNYRKNCERHTGNASELYGRRVGNDKMTSAKVQSREFRNCKPRANQVAFFEHPDFTGKCSIRGFGDYPTSPATGLKNDTLSSILVGSDAQVVICIDRNYRKNCERHVKSISKLHGRRVGNDKMTSAKVQSRGFRNCKPGANQVSFFEHPDFTGKCTTRGFGYYPTSPDTGLNNDTLSSILVGNGAQVVLCKHRNYGTPCEKHTRNLDSMYSFENSIIGNDEVTSAKVYKRGTVDCQPSISEVALYNTPEFIGGCSVLRIGNYTSLESINMRRSRSKLKSISSIFIGSSELQVCACIAVNFGEKCKTFVNSKISRARVKNSEGKYKKIRSLRVQKRGDLCAAVIPSPRPNPPIGYRKLIVFNCASERKDIQVWVRSVSSGEAFRNVGRINNMWVGGSCPRNASGWEYNLSSGVKYEFRFIMPNKESCKHGNNPIYVSCQKGKRFITGGTTRQFLVHTL